MEALDMFSSCGLKRPYPCLPHAPLELPIESPNALPNPRGTLAVVMKNCEPLVFGPPLAMAIKPLLLNFTRRF